MFSVDGYALAKWFVGGASEPSTKKVICLTPFKFARRQLHVFKPIKGGIRKQYGSTRSEGFKRGSIVKHLKHGICYIGGASKGFVSLHNLIDGKRLTKYARVIDIKFKTYSSWRTQTTLYTDDPIILAA